MQGLLAQYCAQGQLNPLWRKKPVPVECAVSFESNDYLALGQNPGLIAAYQEGYARFGTSSSASPMLSGYTEAHQTLESRFCTLFEEQDAMLFSSGFAANLAIGRMLGALSAYVVLDKASHASIYDSLDRHKVIMQRFTGKEQPVLLGTKIEPDINTPQVVWLEGVYSMSGCTPCFKELERLFPDAVYIFDEAHAFGVLGAGGLGYSHSMGVPKEKILFRVIPFGKAMAGQGAIVLGSRTACDVLRQYARSYIYSTAMSSAQAFGLCTALELLLVADEARKKLEDLRQLLQQNAFNTISPSAIQRIYCSDLHVASALQSFLKKRQIMVSLVRPPTVSAKEVGLRIVLNAGHTMHHILALVKALSEYADVAYAD